MGDRDPKTGQWLPGNSGSPKGRMTAGAKLRLKLAEAQAIAKNNDENLMPLDYFLSILRNPAEPQAMRIRCGQGSLGLRASPAPGHSDASGWH